MTAVGRQEASTGRARRGRAVSALAGVALFALWAMPALAMKRVYWANYGDPTNGQPGSIAFANLDGIGGGQLNTTGAKLSNPNGVAIDLTTNEIYWADRTNNMISFAKLDGTGGGQLNTTGATLSAPRGVAIDPATHRIYWTNFDNDTISFANDNGSGGGGQLNTTGASLNRPQGLAIDNAGNRVYWSNQGNPKAGQPGSISFARLNGSGGGQLNTAGAMVYAPTGVAIDQAAKRIYWANQYVNTISFARLDGAGGGGQLNTSGATLHYPVGPAIDPVTRKIYWANVLNDTISFARVDGSGSGGQLNTSGAPLSYPNFPALLYACSVPKLNGKTLARARKLLKKNDCRLGKIRPNGRIRGIVQRQRPKPGRIVPAGGKVDVELRSPRG